MGIAVTIGLLLAVVALLRSERAPGWLVGVVFGLGLWNIGWYGLRHWSEFWGVAALASGALMIAAAAVVRHRIRRGWYRACLVAGLVAFFALYAVTIVRLNLGLSIPG